MKIQIRGKGDVVLNDTKDFVSQGGEAKIYRKGDKAFKIFHDPKKMIPESKFDELSVLTDSRIIKPEEIILNNKGSIIGFTLKWVNGYSMCKVFNTGFRMRESINDSHTVKLVENMREMIEHVHSHPGILIVDFNEMNSIISDDHVTPFFIDVNSWQTKSFPATFLMDSVKDWEHKQFSHLTDWYSFAIISFWLFVGIHPFRGYHPDFNTGDIGERTKNRALSRISALNKSVELAPNARINSIPPHYKDWYLSVFEKGDRSLPPIIGGIIVNVPIQIQRVSGTNNFVVVSMNKYDSNVIWYSKIVGKTVVKTESSINIDSHPLICRSKTELVFTERNLNPILVNIENKKLSLSSPKNNIKMTGDYIAISTMVVGNKLLFINNSDLCELQFEEMGEYVYPKIKVISSILINSCKMFAGFLYQQVFDGCHLIIPFGEKGKNGSITVNVPDLLGYRVIDGKYSNNVAALVVSKDGLYHILVIRFNKEHGTYDFRKINISNPDPINMIVLDSGVCLLIPEDGIMQVFSNKPYSKDLKEISDSTIDSSIRLCKDGTSAMYFKGNEVFKISLK